LKRESKRAIPHSIAERGSDGTISDKICGYLVALILPGAVYLTHPAAIGEIHHYPHESVPFPRACVAAAIHTESPRVT
jgi:hypothetical protein